MSEREETYAAIRKALAVLDDPFTRFLEPLRYQALKRGNAGAGVTGVGLEVGFDADSSKNLVVSAACKACTCCCILHGLVTVCMLCLYVHE